MTSLGSGPELLKPARQARADHGTARLAVAFRGRGAAEAFGLDHTKGVEIICDLEMGGSNPDEIQRLIDLGVRVYAGCLPEEVLCKAVDVNGSI